MCKVIVQSVTRVAAHLLWVVLQDVDQQVVVQAAKLGELEQVGGHQGQQDIQAQDHNLRRQVRASEAQDLV